MCEVWLLLLGPALYVIKSIKGEVLHAPVSKQQAIPNPEYHEITFSHDLRLRLELGENPGKE